MRYPLREAHDALDLELHMENIDYEEDVDLHGLPAEMPLPTANAQFCTYGKQKTTVLHAAVREVVEEWPPMRQASAMICRNGGSLQIKDIRVLYQRADFPAR